MAVPDYKDRVIEPPQLNMSIEQVERWLYDLWDRTGGFESYIPDLSGLTASVPELNTLVGIDTSTTVQAQLNLKFNLASAGTMAYQNANNVNITNGSISGVGITNSDVFGNLRRTVGTSSEVRIPGASLYTSAEETGNTGAAVTDLASYTMFADALGNNGDYIDIEAWGTFAANANAKQIRLYFGTSVIFNSTSLVLNAGSWYLKAKVIREQEAAQNAISSVLSSNTTLVPTTELTNTSEDDGAAIIIKTTGTGVATDDIIQRGMTIKWFAASI